MPHVPQIKSCGIAELQLQNHPVYMGGSRKVAVMEAQSFSLIR